MNSKSNLLGKTFGKLYVVDYAPDYISPCGQKKRNVLRVYVNAEIQ